jgi:hypothetical protein
MAAYTTIDNPELYFQVKTYSGTGSSNAITLDGDEDMSPNLVWIKVRSNATYGHALYDSVRGVNQALSTNSTSAAANDDDSGNTSLNTFGSDGFTLGGFYNKVNQSGQTFVAWCWKAGTTTGITTTGATITPSAYSFNQTPGFSIIQYTGNDTSGAKVPHGLGVAPRMVTIKKEDGVNNWITQHAGINGGSSPYSYDITLNYNYAQDGETYYWNDTAPDSVNFVLGDSNQCNDSTKIHIAYCFADVQGFSKSGWYKGNGNAEGPFIYTGFRPAFVMVKITSSTGNWTMYDNKRLGYNPLNYFLYPNLTNAEDTSNTDWFDMCSNGFKIKNTSGTINSSGASYIYTAFAEAPFVNSEGVPCNAR